MLLSEWPIGCVRDWLARVNQAQGEAELAVLRRSMARGQPYGSEPEGAPEWHANLTWNQHFVQGAAAPECQKVGYPCFRLTIELACGDERARFTRCCQRFNYVA